MKTRQIEGQIFDKVDFTAQPLHTGVYEDCTFTNCNLANIDLSGFEFCMCNFENCNLTMVMMNKTALKDVNFKNCKLLGLHFENCNPFLLTLNFENCMLNLASFYKLNLKKTIFKNCNLQEVDFTETDLNSSLFDNCDLLNATFDHTTLEKTDFRTAYNYSIDPEMNRIKKAKFSSAGIAGLLYKYDISIS